MRERAGKVDRETERGQVTRKCQEVKAKLRKNSSSYYRYQGVGTVRLGRKVGLAAWKQNKIRYNTLNARDG